MTTNRKHETYRNHDLISAFFKGEFGGRVIQRGKTLLEISGGGIDENLAAISGLMKDFFDRSYYAALDRLNGRPYAALVCAGSDGSNAARQIARIATGWRLREIAPPLIVCTHAQTTEAILAPKVVPAAELARGEELGAAFATGLAMGAF